MLVARNFQKPVELSEETLSWLYSSKAGGTFPSQLFSVLERGDGLRTCVCHLLLPALDCAPSILVGEGILLRLVPLPENRHSALVLALARACSSHQHA